MSSVDRFLARGSKTRSVFVITKGASRLSNDSARKTASSRGRSPLERFAELRSALLNNLTLTTTGWFA